MRSYGFGPRMSCPECGNGAENRGGSPAEQTWLCRSCGTWFMVSEKPLETAACPSCTTVSQTTTGAPPLYWCPSHGWFDPSGNTDRGNSGKGIDGGFRSEARGAPAHATQNPLDAACDRLIQTMANARKQGGIY